MAPGCERPRQVVAGPGGCMQSRCGSCTGACAPSPMPRLLRPVPAFPVFCCPRPVARVLRPAPRARVFRLLHFVPPFPVFCCPRPVARVLRPAFCVLRSASCVLRPASCTPCPRAPVPPCPRARARVRVHVFRVLRPAPHARVFRVPHPRPRTLRPCPRLPRPAPRARARARGSVFCVPRTVARVPRPVSPPRTSGQVLPASASRRDEKKIGRLPRGTSRFCMHCSGARLTRACG